MPAPRTIQIELWPDVGAPARGRRAVERLRDAVHDWALADLRVVVSELVANAVLHGGLAEDERIVLRVRVEPETVRVEVEDPGRGFGPRAVPRDRDAGGRGLMLVDRVTSRWGVARDRATRVWAELDGAPRGARTA